METPFMRDLTRFARGASYERLPQEMKKLSKYAVLDVVGVALAGWHEPAPTILRRTLLEGAPDGKASLWGEKRRVAPNQAALANGTASHALDYDDVAPSVLTHPSAPVLAALIPMAEELGSSGKEVMTAYAVGTEVMSRIGIVLGYRHYDIGWHATDTLGTVGAAVACGHLMDLDGRPFANAVAISGSLAGGLRKNFGTMTKPLHVGMAASHAIEAVMLASEGFTADEDIFGDNGYFTAFGGAAMKGRPVKFGRPFDLLASGLSVKKFPCCYATHRLIKGVLDLREKHSLSLAGVNRVVCELPPRAALPLIHHRPKTGLQAKFSAEYTVIASLADGIINLRSFDDSEVNRPEIQRALEKVEIKERRGSVEQGLEIEEEPITVTIEIEGGKRYQTVVRYAPGSKNNPLTEEERLQKWTDCVNYFCRRMHKHEGRSLSADSRELFDKMLAIHSYPKFSDWMVEFTEKLL